MKSKTMIVFKLTSDKYAGHKAGEIFQLYTTKKQAKDNSLQFCGYNLFDGGALCCFKDCDCQAVKLEEIKKIEEINF